MRIVKRWHGQTQAKSRMESRQREGERKKSSMDLFSWRVMEDLGGLYIVCAVKKCLQKGGKKSCCCNSAVGVQYVVGRGRGLWGNLFNRAYDAQEKCFAANWTFPPVFPSQHGDTFDLFGLFHSFIHPPFHSVVALRPRQSSVHSPTNYRHTVSHSLLAGTRQWTTRNETSRVVSKPGWKRIDTGR